ncbi:cyclin N-terminal domain-containing protein 2 isoform X4 [Dunckerocampus dactyliophorus]|uniref:cyclin N-terminal domain-containing protein 2 isoform X4 n=1 Tax=Dunckerocampus dactyliophorus TaxID=161453 RepID=UPI002406969B|nr:cyclin N-terminal domain-containing protein 2 isoform X4 [Dunckerocampus dactyliophorus]
MARTGFCDSMPLLDLHKADERRAPLRTWATACGATDFVQPMEMSASRMVAVKRNSEHERERMLSAQTSNGVFEAWTYSAGGIIPAKADGCLEEHSLYPRSLQGLHSLQVLMPSLLRHEVEMALEKLDLVLDRTYAWEMFSDMMELMHFQEETLYLAIHLLNRSLCQLKVTTANLQLLGMVCLFLAAKKEESLLPEVSGLCYLMDHAYTKHQLLRMERKVLSGLKFNLSYCQPLYFLHLLASIARCSAQMTWMARYLLELSLFEGQCVVFLPVQLAGAALCLARQVLQEPPTPEGEAAWCLASSIYVSSEAVLLRIMQILAGAAARAHTRETCATFIKFSSPETMHISRHTALKQASALLGVCT